MTKLFELEHVIKKADVEIEDDGCAKIVDVCEDGGSTEEYMFVRIQSWSESEKHADFNKMIGKKIKVTIEILD